MQLGANVTGAILMVASMAAFAVEDLFLKGAAVSLPPGQVTAMMGAAGAVLFWAIAASRGQRVLSRKLLSPLVIMRSASEGFASMLYIASLAALPLTVNSALLQASPLVVTAGAALFLGEQVGWRRWSAIGVGFIGVLVILRPATDGFAVAGLLTVACVVFLAARDLATRRMPHDAGTWAVMVWAYIAIIPSGLILTWLRGESLQPIAPDDWSGLIIALICGMAGYWAVTTAMRAGDVSVVAPYRYTRLVFAAILGMLFLGEQIDAYTLTGSALIIGSGLYTLAREARRRGAKAV